MILHDSLKPVTVSIRIVAVVSRSPCVEPEAPKPKNFRLDANACIHILNGSSQTLVDNLHLIQKFSKLFLSVVFDERCAEHYGLIRSELQREGRMIGSNDLVIAATARAVDITLLIHNAREFSRAVGRRVEDWEAPSG